MTVTVSINAGTLNGTLTAVSNAAGVVTFNNLSVPTAELNDELFLVVTNFSTTSMFFDIGVPTLTAVNPNAGPMAGGTSVIITGTNFTAATAVNFGATPAASFTVNSATQITAVAPAEAPATVDVTVTTAGGTTALSAADQFTFLAAPTVSSLNPTFGSTAGGTSVIITGTNFTGATAVSFGGTPAAGFVVNSPTQITATSPAHAAGVDNVTVTSPGGTSAISPADQFTFIAPPVVTSLNPNAGPTAGGTTVIITGSDFPRAAVTFGATPAASFVVNSPTQITAVAPAEPAGTVNVTVTNAAWPRRSLLGINTRSTPCRR